MHSTLPKHDVVLVGAGHTNAHVLRMWRMRPLADARLTLVSNFSEATYSGMLPGTLAGLYPPGRMQIDLVRLCAAGGVRFIRGEATGLDAAAGLLHVAGRPAIRYDILSIGIGSAPRADGVQIDDEAVVSVKPMQTFLARLDARLESLRAAVAGRPLRAAVVGGGAGGVEIALCLPGYLTRVWGTGSVEITLVDAGPRLVMDRPENAAALAAKELEARGVRLILGQTVRSVADGRLTLSDGREEPVDIVIWAAGVRAPDALAAYPLPKDENGFLLTRATLQTVADVPIFAVGDAGTIQGSRTPKAGVYAVRQGPILWRNIEWMLRGEPLEEYVPQRGFLSLLATGDRRAILSYKGLAFHGEWCWRLKDYIDSRFMDKYQDYTPAMARPPVDDQPQMRCAGCGGKVSGSVLSRVLERLEIAPAEHVLLGLSARDDAAIIAPPGGRPIVATADFFTAFLDDPYLVGRVAALNAASDLFAMGARPLAALALATVPIGPPLKQEELLYELLAGGIDELRRMGATLVGGHTIEGTQTMIGYSMLADAGSGRPRTKAGLRPGDQLVLTKPLGTGILLAAQMQARCRAAWYQPLVELLTASNQPAAEACNAFDIQGMTDVTGFGLAGHLLEMLQASEVAAELSLDDVPLLPGVSELVAEGVESTLAPANRLHETEIDAGPKGVACPRLPGHSLTPDNRGDMSTASVGMARSRYAALFDPQTSGGLLLGVSPDQLDSLLARLSSSSPIPPAVIGKVLPFMPNRPRIRLV